MMSSGSMAAFAAAAEQPDDDRPEQPIVGMMFTAESVTAIDANRKSQTRRLLTHGNTYVDGSHWPRGVFAQLEFDKAWVDGGPSPAGNAGPYLHVPRYDPTGGGRYPEGGTVHRVYPAYRPGDRWYVKETWGCPVADHPRVKKALGPRVPRPGDRIVYKQNPADAYQWDTSNPSVSASFGWRSPLMMPRWAARYFLEVTAVRIERLQDMPWRDAILEGVEPVICKHEGAGPMGCTDCMGTGILENPRDDYEATWGQLHRDPGTTWADNPWVIVYNFKRVTEP